MNLLKVIAGRKTFSMFKYDVIDRDMLQSTYLGYCFQARQMK